MRIMFKKTHRWIGLVLAGVMLVISVTGTMLLWKREYLWLTIPDARQDLRLAPAELNSAIEAMQLAYNEDELSFVQLGSENLSLHRAYLSDKRYAWHNHQGEQLQLFKGNDRFEDFLLDLHHRFLLGNTIGLNIAGFGGIFLLPLMILGLIIWWPRRRLLVLGVRPKSKQRGAWMRSHSNLGAMSLIPILLISITGVILVYPTESRFIVLGGFDDPAPVPTHQITLEKQPNIEAGLVFAETLFPASRPRWISLPSSQRQSFAIGIERHDSWNRMGNTSLTFEPNGEVRVVDEREQSRLKRVFDFSYPLHTGKFSWLVRLLLSLIGVVFIALISMGVNSFFKSRD